jgi:hypothetical protein
MKTLTDTESIENRTRLESEARNLVDTVFAKPTAQHHTAAGTPCAASWTRHWISRVSQLEKEFHRRICGAKLPDGSLCELESRHPSGRCRLHGGADITGAPPGNHHATIHDLYERRLKTCGRHCPMWNECPCAGPDVAALAPSRRPTCPYEKAEYDTAVAAALTRARKSDAPNPTLDAHTLALLQVMITRAALAIRNTPLAHDMGIIVEGMSCPTETKPNAHFLAFTRAVAEYRRFTTILKPGKHKSATLDPGSMALLHLGTSHEVESPCVPKTPKDFASLQPVQQVHGVQPSHAVQPTPVIQPPPLLNPVQYQEPRSTPTRPLNRKDFLAPPPDTFAVGKFADIFVPRHKNPPG